MDDPLQNGSGLLDAKTAPGRAFFPSSSADWKMGIMVEPFSTFVKTDVEFRRAAQAMGKLTRDRNGAR